MPTSLRILEPGPGNEPWLGAFFLASAAGVGIIGPDLRYLRVNDTLAEMNGCPPSAHIGRTVREVLPALAATVEPLLLGVIETGQPVLNLEINGQTAAQPGRTRFWNISYFPLPVSGTERPGVGVVCVEITARKDAEARLQQSEELWRSVFAAAHDAILVIDAEGRILAANDSACRLYRYSVEELVRLRLRDLQAATIRLPSEAEEGGLLRDTVHRRKDGRTFPVEVSIQPFMVAGEVRQVKIVRDVTARRAAEEQVRFHASLLDQVRNAVVASDAEGRVIYWNRFSEELYGWEAGEALGRHLFDLHIPAGGVVQASEILELLQRGEGWQGEMTLRRKDGREFSAWVFGAPLRDAEGNVFGFVGVSLDLTQAKRTEEELTQSREQMRRLAARIDAVREEEARRIARDVHDTLGQQLTALKLDLQHLQARLPKGSRTLVRHCERMQGLLDGTLESAQRISSELRLGHLEVVGLAEAITWHLREFEKRTRIECDAARVAEIADVDQTCATVAVRIFQEALTNVARHAGATRVEVALYARGSDLVLCVSDNGRGITQQQIDQPQSIGLLGMRERAQGLGGTVTIEREKEGGTTVTAVLPCSVSN